MAEKAAKRDIAQEKDQSVKKVRALLEDKKLRLEVQEKWKSMVHGTYPFDTVGFLHTNTNQFANPVGYRTNEAAEAIVAMLLVDTPDVDALGKAVDEIIQVRAIQEFSPEAAVGIFYGMKDILREMVENAEQPEDYRLGLQELESRLDAVSLMAFGVYARCREKLHLIRVDEVKRSTSQLRRLAERRGSLPVE